MRGSFIVAQFPYNAGLVDIIRSIPERSWSPRSKVWFWPATPSNMSAVLAKLSPLDFKTDESVNEYKRSLTERLAMSRSLDGGSLPGMYPFQVAAVKFARETGYRVLVADAMGCGKSVEAIAIALDAGKFPALVVCPSAVKRHWEEHIHKWAAGSDKQRVQVLSGREYALDQADWYVVNYEVLDGKRFDFVRTVIVDESHYIKNPKAKRTDEVRIAAKYAQTVLCLDGTPILNRPKDLFPVLNMLKPSLYSNFFQFALKFCAGTKTPFGWNFDGASNLDTLAEELRSTCMIRRTKEEVLPDLPEKTRAFLPLDIDMNAYDGQSGTFDDWIESRGEAGVSKAEALVKVGAMRRFVCDQKYRDVLAWCRDFLETGRSLVIFTHHRQYAKKFADALQGALYSGEVSHEERDLAVARFQAGEVKVIALTLDSGGEGITLHRAQDALFFEVAWNASKQRQAEDRIHRIGQKGAVTCYYPYARNTVEDTMLELLRWKAETSDQGLADPSDAFAEFLAARITNVRKKQKRG